MQPGGVGGANNPIKYTWHQVEILAMAATGEILVAVNGKQTTTYKKAGRARKGPIGLQAHAGASNQMYRDIWVEVNPTERRLVTVKPPAATRPSRRRDPRARVEAERGGLHRDRGQAGPGQPSDGASPGRSSGRSAVRKSDGRAQAGRAFAVARPDDVRSSERRSHERPDHARARAVQVAVHHRVPYTSRCSWTKPPTSAACPNSTTAVTPASKSPDR